LEPPVLFIPEKDNPGLEPTIGVIIDIDYESIHPSYLITFDDGDEDWYSDEEGLIEEIVENYEKATNGELQV
jgi:hypothetical protein